MLTVKTPLLLILFIAVISLSLVNIVSQHRIDSEEVSGHFTQKNKVEKVWLVPPQINADETGCIAQSALAKPGDCVAHLNFSDPAIRAILVNGCIGGTPVNLGDLDNDGLDEIGLLPEWFSSCWRDYKVYTFKQNAWQLALPPFATHCNQWDKNLKPIVKDPAKKGNVIITYSAFVGDTIVIKTKSVPVK